MTRKKAQIEVLLNNLAFIDRVESLKTTYYVFKGEIDYVIVSYRDAKYRSGSFNIVSSDMLVRIRNTFSGKQRLTRREIEEHRKMKRFAGKFDVLQALYVLVALGDAKLDRRSPKSRTLYFNIKA
jgi:hypothetical protein